MARRAKSHEPEAIEGQDDAPRTAVGLLVLLDGTGANLHAVGSRLGEIANIIDDAIAEAEGVTKAALTALATLL